MAFRNRFTALAVVLLTFALLLISAVAGTEGAAAARYVVAQCGWHAGQDASWFDSSADRFLKSSYCQPPASADPFEGVHLISQVKGSSQTVGGTRFAAWRWQAPSGTGIVNIHGQRWQYLREGFEHKLGGVPPNGTFKPFLELDTSDGTKRDFWQGFSPYAQAFETRLVCFRQSDKVCDVNGTILAGVRSLTISIDDAVKPTSEVSGALTGTGWLRGSHSLAFSNRDTGAGLRYAQTSIDGALRASSEMSCAMTMISGQWRGTKMQPCPVTATGSQTVDTRGLPDGPHVLRHCAIDFAGITGCATDRTIRVDNNAPAAPRDLIVEGGEDWHRTNGFNLGWTEPAQGVASPIASSLFSLSGPGGYAGGPWGRNEAARISGVQVPGPGEYRVRVWLVDEAGNSDETHAAEATLRLDNVPPTGYFVDPPEEDPAQIRVPVADQFSGVAGGSIAWRPATGGEWHGIPSHYSTDGEPALNARFPSDLPRGSWVLRAAVVDRAGNLTVTDRRANGSQMIVKTPLRDETTVSAGFITGTRSGRNEIETGYGRRAHLSGRLTGVESGGIDGAELTVTSEPYPGSRQAVSSRKVQTDPRGYFDLWLAPGPGRRVKVEFAGSRRLEASASGALELKVRGRLDFRARPQRLRTGQKVRFRGRVLARGAWQPVRGNLIQIQYFEESARRWRPVALTRTDRYGHYRTSYRFRYITGVARIRLRALLVPSSRFPYSGAASKPVVIRVRG
ncbi:MAG: Ig-like domain repeat protein [Solirubrobacterales bacterium]